VSFNSEPVDVAGPRAESAVVERQPSPTAARVLDERERGLLRTALNRIVPARLDLPGAGDLDVGSSIEGALAVSPRLRRLFLDGLIEIELTANRRNARSFADLDPSAQDLVLLDEEQASPAFFEALVERTYRGYYSLPVVHEAIGHVSRPPQPLGFELPPFDPSLLDRQRRRTPFWRKA
jgi:hypothetical protein